MRENVYIDTQIFFFLNERNQRNVSEIARECNKLLQCDISNAERLIGKLTEIVYQ
ncbi:11269_t:CDS:2 [Dentiscutata erythropus]|uniref:11269_t:CDS:1 n=1 Tax=Dentiscutata erythropus TaxID=1348616 RepID=A0A9N8VRX6_9GLOM|nr:11269_t:CDS:2 [Dentiscutata erythropus]